MVCAEIERIIIIDDDHVNNIISSKTLGHYCKNSELEMYCFNDSRDGLAFIKKMDRDRVNKTTLLFIDMNMPFLDGLEIVEELKNSNDFIKQYFTVYMLTSSTDEYDIMKAKNEPLISMFLSKPLAQHLPTIMKE